MGHGIAPLTASAPLYTTPTTPTTFTTTLQLPTGQRGRDLGSDDQMVKVEREFIVGSPDKANILAAREVLRNFVLIDGKPVEIKESDRVSPRIKGLDDGNSSFPEFSHVRTIQEINHPERNTATTTTIQRTIRRRVIKKIIYINGEPVETEEIVEEPEVSEVISPGESMYYEEPTEETSTTIQRTILKRTINKVVYVDGQAVEREEVTEDPQEIDHRTINRVIYIDGKPVGKDEVIIDPETSDHTVKQRNIARKLIYIEGKPSSSSVDRTTSEWEKREIDSNGGKHFSTSCSTAMS